MTLAHFSYPAMTPQRLPQPTRRAFPYLALLGHDRQLQLEVTRAPADYWLATHPDILVYGTGETPQAAVREFVELAQDLHRELHDSRNVLAPHLLHDLDVLNQVFGSLGA